MWWAEIKQRPLKRKEHQCKVTTVFTIKSKHSRNTERERETALRYRRASVQDHSLPVSDSPILSVDSKHSDPASTYFTQIVTRVWGDRVTGVLPGGSLTDNALFPRPWRLKTSVAACRSRGPPVSPKLLWSDLSMFRKIPVRSTAH